MKRLLLIVLNLFLITIYSQSKGKVLATISSSKILDNYKDSIADKNYGVSILLSRKGAVFQDIIGKSSKDNLLTSKSVFNIGNSTKTLTAVLILQEIEKGKLKLTDSIGSFFPFNKNVNQSITILNLLNHTSGLGEFSNEEINNNAFNDPFYPYNHINLYFNISEPIAKMNDKYYYSNTNYIILGYLLEVLNDTTYENILKERIFEPCGMTNSYAYCSKKIENLVHPIVQGFDLSKYTNFYYYKNLGFSSSGVCTSLDDFSKFLNALFVKKSLLNSESLRLMTKFNDGVGLGINAYKNDDEIYFGNKSDGIGYPFCYYFNLANNNFFIASGSQYNISYFSKIENEGLQFLKLKQ